MKKPTVYVNRPPAQIQDNLSSGYSAGKDTHAQELADPVEYEPHMQNLKDKDILTIPEDPNEEDQ